MNCVFYYTATTVLKNQQMNIFHDLSNLISFILQHLAALVLNQSVAGHIVQRI